jgi:two-component system phosphate regulon sensor histidine kinase PhoR
MIPEETSAIQPFVKMIQDENQRLSILVERILQSAVMDRGDLKLKEESVILNEIIHDVANNAQFRMQHTGGQIKLHLPVELITLKTDKMHLTNVISNLIDNGIKYSQDEPIIDVFLKREAKKIVLSVADKGIGIKKEHLPKIFDKLYRVPTGNLHNVKGFGLGLSYVKAISELNGWNITVRSKFGEGSEFYLTIKEQE